jgi:hypothetical protein
VASDPISIGLPGNESPLPILILQFATGHPDEEAEAKLARQIPRVIGRKLNLTGRFDARFLSFRDRVIGEEVFVNSTQLPEHDALDEIAGHHRIRYVLFGRFGVGERITMEVHLYDAERRAAIFRKGFETYAAYTFDVFDEVCVRTAQAVGVELDKRERVRLFQRATTSWESFLYYLLAEDDRYGLAVGVPPLDFSLTQQAYLESLRHDPDAEEIEASAVAFALEGMAAEGIGREAAEEYLRQIAGTAPELLAARQALMYLSFERGDHEEARRWGEELVALRPEDPMLRAEVAELFGG